MNCGVTAHLQGISDVRKSYLMWGSLFRVHLHFHLYYHWQCVQTNSIHVIGLLNHMISHGCYGSLYTQISTYGGCSNQTKEDLEAHRAKALAMKSNLNLIPEPMQRLKEKNPTPTPQTSICKLAHMPTTHIYHTNIVTKGSVNIHIFIGCLWERKTVCTCHGLHVKTGQFVGIVFSFHQVGPRNLTQVVRFNGKCSYLMSHLTCPKLKNKIK